MSHHTVAFMFTVICEIILAYLLFVTINRIQLQFVLKSTLKNTIKINNYFVL